MFTERCQPRTYFFPSVSFRYEYANQVLYDIVATTAEKLEGTSRDVEVNPLLPLLRLFPVSRYRSTRVSPIPFPTLRSFSL